MDALAWVCLFLVAFPVPFLFWFGLIPLWVDRQLRRVGREVLGHCRTVSTSEGRYSTSFEFSTQSGDRIIYISPLAGTVWGRPGKKLSATETSEPAAIREWPSGNGPQDASTAALIRCPNAFASLRAAPRAKPTRSLPTPWPSRTLKIRTRVVPAPVDSRS